MATVVTPAEVHSVHLSFSALSFHTEHDECTLMPPIVSGTVASRAGHLFISGWVAVPLSEMVEHAPGLPISVDRPRFVGIDSTRQPVVGVSQSSLSRSVYVSGASSG